MTDPVAERVITAKITRAGMKSLFLATNNGLQLNLDRIIVGDGGGNGYAPTGLEEGMKNPFAGTQIGGGDYLGDFEMMVQGLFAGAETGWVNEVGIYTSTGILFALWSEPNAPLAYKSANVPLVIALTLALSEVPANSVAFVVGAPSVNLTIAGPFADLTASVLDLQTRALQADVDRYSISMVANNSARFGVV